MSVIISPSGRRYDRIRPAPLPAHRVISRRAAGQSLVFDGRPWKGPTKNQGSLGSCTGHAGTSAVEWIYRKYLRESPVLSPLFTYSEELLAQGSFPQDVGSDGDTLCNVLISKGACLDSLYPDASGQILEPSAAQLSDALARRMGAYHGLANSEVAQSVLTDPVPWPVLIGFEVFESFEGEISATGIMSVPASSERLLGGHEVLIIGCDLGATASFRPANCPPSFLVQNSWGETWGWGGGLFWMPPAILDAPNTDLKIIHIGKPWSLAPSKN